MARAIVKINPGLVTYLKDIQANNVAPQTITAGSYQTVRLSTQEGDTSFCSLSSNQFTLQPGTYEILVTVPGRTAGGGATNSGGKAKVRNVTDSTDALIGSRTQGSEANGVNNSEAFVMGQFTITAVKIFEVQFRCSGSSSALGTASNFTENEVYQMVKLTKVA